MDLDTLNEAEGFFQLCLWQDAWDAMEGMHKGERHNPEVAHLRLRIAVELEDWEACERVANHVSSSPRVDLKRSAAQFFLDRARVHSDGGDSAEALRNFRKALSAWKGIRKEFTESENEGLGPELEQEESTSGHAAPPSERFVRLVRSLGPRRGSQRPDPMSSGHPNWKLPNRRVQNLRRYRPAGSRAGETGRSRSSER
ncbi:MAG: hypothetical protein AAGA96_08935 [Verrucomicrobiota bacterium]